MSRYAYNITSMTIKLYVFVYFTFRVREIDSRYLIYLTVLVRRIMLVTRKHTGISS